MSKLLKSVKCLIIPQRANSGRNYVWPNEGIQYFGFKYYPRRKDFEDPPYEPSKLFRVQRIKPLKGVPYYEKKILQEFGLMGKGSEFAIIKNIPDNNHRLWRIKHLIDIKPITFPNGFPTDINGTYLKENGELIVKHVLVASEEKLQLTEEFKSSKTKMDGDTLRRDSRKKWLSGW